ncbi:unnamed protein product [Miscanthus lutarioriparius]|uniref:Uncharacterized protein n=1 Tax=Miscanthus lutarioriparius TaxID=422564 RepID=A0A811P7E2_9POAL|nr:unnamed protein product [Miscanthus lutarioriparius]
MEEFKKQEANDLILQHILNLNSAHGYSRNEGIGNSSLAGAADLSGLEPWRELFRGRDIYDVIGKVILVAATDSPQEFRRRRDGIMEQIYTAPTVPIPQGRAAAAGERSGRALEVSDKGSKVATCTVAPAEEPEDNNDKKKGIAAAQHANGDGDKADDADYGAAGMEWLQCLADQMDAESLEINEVLRIKDILLNHHEQSADNLFDSLRRPQLMELTADKIKPTNQAGEPNMAPN